MKTKEEQINLALKKVADYVAKANARERLGEFDGTEKYVISFENHRRNVYNDILGLIAYE